MAIRIAYCVRQIRDGKSIWTRIGRCFPHRDGKGEDLVLNALPIADNGKVKITIREEEKRLDEEDSDLSPDKF
jgi:hypothetical protein